MASIMKRGSAYSVRYTYTDHRGKTCSGWESFKTKKEAQERKVTIEKELQDGTFLVPDSMTVQELLEKWIPIQSSKHKWAPKTYTHTVATVQNLIVPYIGGLQVQNVRTFDLEQLYTTLSQTPKGLYKQGKKQQLTPEQRKRHLTTASIHEVHALLKTAFSYAVEWDLIHKSPVPREAPKLTSEERTIWDECTMLAALQTMEDPALHLAAHLSMILSLRAGEILGLQPEDLDFNAADGRGTITIRRSMQRTDKVALEKTDPSQVCYVFPDQREGSSTSLILKKPKTKKSQRVLYMTKPLKEELLAWLEKLKRDEAEADGRYRNCGQLFRLPNGLPVAPEALSKWYRDWREHHPEFEKIVFHGLRHSSATYQLMISCGDVKAVQGTTGHASADMLVNTYAHIQQSSRKELGRKFEESFYAKPKSSSPQTTPAESEPTISMSALLDLLNNADPAVKAQLRLALMT